MTDPLINPQNDHPSVIRPARLVAGFLWLCCILAIMGIWYRLPVTDVSDNDGRVTKTMKLDPGQGNELNIREVADPAHDDPWDADGIEDFSFTDSQGNRCQKKDLIGKPFVISFIFTYCRGPCPNVSLQMRELHERFKNYDFNLVSLTVDPERDTAEVLQEYGKSLGADFSRWRFLSGTQAEIYGLIHRSFKVPVEEATGIGRQPGFEIIHSTNIMLVNENGRVIGKFNAQQPEEMAKLRKELKRIAPLKKNPLNTTNR